MPTGVYPHQPLTPERKAQISQVAKERGYGLWMKGRTASKETKTKMAAACRARKEKFGYYHTPKGLAKMREKRGAHLTHKRLAQRRKSHRNGEESPCLQCGQTIYIPPYLLKSKRFCSNKCNATFRKGERAAHWKGGKGTERHIAMNREAYKVWRQAVFQRDNFTCQICQKRNTKLNADHILSWRNFPEERYNISNGRTLCRECHFEKHHPALVPA